MNIRTIAIAGAGLSGLAVAVALRKSGFDGSIDIVDAKPRFSDDRTWCFWDTGGIPFAEVADRSWARWAVSYLDRSGTVDARTARYLHVSSVDYYAACLARLARTDTTISLNERVTAIEDGAEAAILRTARREFRVDLIVDARGRRESADLHQHFYGLRVVADEPVFDPQTVTLMDFARKRGGLHFMYVLPFSRYEALVEDTVVDGAAANEQQRRSGIERYLRDRYGLRAWRELGSEAGAIPLDARRVAPFASPRVVRAGVGAGATRASSGYTFVRTQRHAKAIAAYVMDGRPLPRAGSPGYAVLDGLALMALRNDAIDVPHIVTQLCTYASGVSLARFLNDAASPRDLIDVFGAIACAFPGALRRGHGGAAGTADRLARP